VKRREWKGTDQGRLDGERRGATDVIVGPIFAKPSEYMIIMI